MAAGPQDSVTGYTDILVWFSYAGTFVFAISGALLALRKSMDFVGVSFLATLTGIGGGTVRDVLLGDTPVGWVNNPTDIGICICAAFVVCLLHKELEGRKMSWLLYADAAGLALFAVLGSQKAQMLDAHPAIAILFGAMSATFGGIIRDVVARETPVVFRKEIYVTAALLGSAVFILAPTIIPFEVRAVAGLLVALSIRLIAIDRQWSLPFPAYNK